MTVLRDDAGDAPANADAPGTRLTYCLLTDPSVALTLPRVVSGLKGFLRARGVTGCEIEDYVQEALGRAVAKRITYSTPDELLAWCMVVARNLVVDESRKMARRRHLTLVEEPVGDAEADALSKLGAVAVLDALRRLSVADREALTTRVVPQDRRESNRLAQRRTRARVRLRTLMGGALAALWLPSRRVWRAGPAGMVTVSCVAITLAQTIAPAPSPSRPPSIGSPSAHIQDSVSAPTPQPQAQVGKPDPAAVEAPRPRPRPSAQPSVVRRLVVAPPGTDQGLYVDERDRTPDDRLVCADSVPLLGRVCTPT